MVLTALFYSLLLSSQTSEQYFNDNLLKEGTTVEVYFKYNNNIIVGGRSFDKAKYNPAIICIDTLGNVLWSTSDNDTSVYNWGTGGSYVYKMTLGMDKYIYAAVFIGISGTTQLWKVDPKDGKIIWKNSINFYYTSTPRHLIDYDSTKFIFTYPVSYNGGYYSTKMAYVSKSTGDTLSTHFLGNMPFAEYRYGLCIDDQKNIYATVFDTIYKLNGSNPNNVIWKKRYSSPKVKDYHHLYYDVSTSSLFIFGRLNYSIQYGLIVKANPTNGAFISADTAYTGDVEFREMKVYNGHIYVSWRHIYVGGFNPAFWASKYNMSTGKLSWTTFRAFPGGGKQAAMSLDIDNSQNVYLTGYYKDANYGPANWGIMKINGNNGDTIYTKRIAQDYNIDDQLSSGKGVCIINNQPYFVGQMETNHNFFENLQNSAATLVKLEASTGKVVLQKSIYGTFQYPSITSAIKNFKNGKTLVIKQVGLSSVLEMYDSVKKIMWSQKFSRPKFLIGGVDVSYTPVNSDIYFAAYSQGESATTPSYATFTDSIFIFQLNDSGRLLKTYSFLTGAYYCAPLEIYTDSSSTILFYSKNNLVYYRKISAGSITSEYTTQIPVNLTLVRSKYVHNVTTAKTLIFGKRSSATRMAEITKGSMGIANISVLPQSLTNINYVYEIDPFKVAICGKDNLNRESIGVYHFTVKDTVWTKVLSSDTGSEVLKCVGDPTKKFLYSISHRASNIFIRKHDIINGQLKWAYTFNGVDNLDDWPTDISFDSLRNQLLITGYETSKSNKKVLVLVMDTSGKLLNKISRDGDFKGNNTGACTQVLYKGDRWVGGNITKNAYGLAGFIFEIGECKTNPSSISPISCLQYKSPSGKYTWNTSGVYGDTIKNVSGCDSVITISLTIVNNSTSSISPTSCNTFKSPSGKYTWSTTGTYKDTLANSNGCDSIITVNLTIANFSTSTISPVFCKSYKSPSGKYTWTQSGTYLDSTKTTSGCDSIITVNLTINKTDTSVTVTNNVLMANATSAVYQWIDCNTKLPISGANAQQFSPTVNGDYAVIITQNNCTDTSACYTITNVRVEEVSANDIINAYPNPLTGLCRITSVNGFEQAIVRVTNYSGQTVFEKTNLQGNTIELDLSGLSESVYILEILNSKGIVSRIKLIKF